MTSPASRSSGISEPSVLLDCRWLSINGAGRLTELLLRSLAADPPPGRWILWGPEELTDLAWDGAETVFTDADPRALFGQRSWFSLPPCDLAVFFHQQRPLRAIPSVTMILDTIPLRFATNAVDRAVKRLFLRRVASASKEVVTISEYSRACIERDLGLDPESVTVLVPPVDEALGQRVRALRRRLPPAEAALYVGAFLPHKNLDRLIAAFGRTQFAAGGGKLWLVGGAPDHRAELVAGLTADQRRYVELSGRCTQEDLEARFATALFLVQPSLEEGFGLPVWEALSCDLPVCVSDGGSLPEITAGLVEPFAATSVDAMVTSLDICAADARRRRLDGAVITADWPGRHAARPEEFARRFTEIVWRNLS